MAPTPIDQYRKQAFSGPVGSQTRTFDVYCRGEGPPVIMMQELPGIGQEALRFADKLIEAGFQVWLPHWFGPIGRISFAGNIARVFCMRREFQLFSKNKSSAIVDWMRALAAHVREETGANGVGVIGMCLSGNFAMALIADENVRAAVASQPSLPIGSGAPHLSEAEIAASKAGIDEKGAMYAYRFEGDKLCFPGRFERIGEAFNTGRERVRLRELPGNGHSVFTVHFVNDGEGPTAHALAEMVGYFRQQLTLATPS